MAGKPGVGIGNRNTWIKPRPASEAFKKLSQQDKKDLLRQYRKACKENTLSSLNKDALSLMREIGAIKTRANVHKDREGYNKKQRDYRKTKKWKIWQKNRHKKRMAKRKAFRKAWAQKNPIAAVIKYGCCKYFKSKHSSSFDHKNDHKSLCKSIYNGERHHFTDVYPDADRRILEQYFLALKELNQCLKRFPSPAELATLLEWPTSSLYALTLELKKLGHYTAEEIELHILTSSKALNIPGHSIVQDVKLWKLAASKLPSRDRRDRLVFKYRLPRLEHNKVVRALTLRELGKLIGVTYQRIEQIEVRALEYLRWKANQLGGYEPRLPETFRRPQKPKKRGLKGLRRK